MLKVAGKSFKTKVAKDKKVQKTLYDLRDHVRLGHMVITMGRLPSCTKGT